MTISIADDSFILGSIKRKQYRNYNKRNLYRYNGVVADLSNGHSFVHDALMHQMHEEVLISDHSYNAYTEALGDLFDALPESEDTTDELWFDKIEILRSKHLNQEMNQRIKMIEEVQLKDEFTGIDQRIILEKFLERDEAFFIFINDCKYLTIIKEIYSRCNKDKVTFVIHKKHEAFIKSILIDATIIVDDSFGGGFSLNKYNVPSSGVIIGFGEWFIGAFKNLNVPAFVCCESNEILTRGLTNTTDKRELHFIYVPKDFNILSAFYVVEKSIMNYRLYSFLYMKEGESAYHIEISELMKKYPEYFICYDMDTVINFDQIGPLNHTSFYSNRVGFLNETVLNHHPDMMLGQKIFKDEDDNPIKVNYLKMSKYNMNVSSYNEAMDIRGLMRKEKSSLALITNFLFFTTEKTIDTYNTLRKNRPDEQYHHHGWHMDYMLDEYEKFPLYNKAMIAMGKDGRVKFSRKRLQGGTISIGNKVYKWTKDQVDTDKKFDFKIYTPMYYRNNDTNYFNDFFEVGDGRINVVIVNNEIVTVKEGNVLLPSIGVVLSFDKQIYNEVDKCSNIVLKLDGSDEYEWAYGGGMFLIHNGQALDSVEKLKAGFDEEGWLCNMSKQTQDSETFRLDKHPRTVIGETYSGELFIIVCSGRSIYSVGADYFDLIKIAKSLFKDVRYLMNLDGGASSLMGAVFNGEVFTLNDITYTNDSCAGMVRPLNSMIKIEL